ncbi:hypothetical protein KPL70_026437 [Citrus sinensis]|nr:hypothetical protein KPL70_026437 [Citrus sinensis]
MFQRPQIGSPGGCGWSETTEGIVGNKTQVVLSPETGEIAPNDGACDDDEGRWLRWRGRGNGKATKGARTTEEEQNQLSLVAFVMAALRKSMVSCRVERGEDVISAVHNMEIGCPTNVRHITHATFDRFNDFLGLPVEFEVEVPCRVPSAR